MNGPNPWPMRPHHRRRRASFLSIAKHRQSIDADESRNANNNNKGSTEAVVTSTANTLQNISGILKIRRVYTINKALAFYGDDDDDDDDDVSKYGCIFHSTCNHRLDRHSAHIQVDSINYQHVTRRHFSSNLVLLSALVRLWLLCLTLVPWNRHAELILLAVVCTND